MIEKEQAPASGGGGTPEMGALWTATAEAGGCQPWHESRQGIQVTRARAPPPATRVIGVKPRHWCF